MQTIPLSGVEADIGRLDVAIRQLKIQYDMFFAGALPREPVELRAEVDKIIRRHTYTPFHKYAHRFHFNALVSRYNSLSELWGKTTRTLEEGDRKLPSSAEKLGIKEHLLARCKVADTAVDVSSLRRLHTRYVDARRRFDGESRAPSFDSFVRGIDAQLQRLRKESGCDQIELRLVQRDDKIQLKARPGR